MATEETIVEVISYGERTKSWRGGRDVTRKYVIVSSYDVKRLVLKALQMEGAIPFGPDPDNLKYDVNVEFMKISEDTGNPVPGYISQMQIGFMVDTAEAEGEE